MSVCVRERERVGRVEVCVSENVSEHMTECKSVHENGCVCV